ncbi:MAG TPA: GNAT family N-acetyltransferase [Solirubrobacterales bacterium]|jgi:predicted N-acetyltransferase YhbS|nr:GNAT family N-acetyltransferase [Solirubrobacterales bacterium]
MAYIHPESLTRAHRREGFESGQPELDRWLADHALTAHSAGGARVYVAIDGARVVGYYALAAAQVAPLGATERALKGQPRRRPVPAVLLARLAVDLEHQGKGLGRSLLQDAMLRTNDAASDLGVRVMLVHAQHERASRWYQRFGFEESPTDSLHLMLLLKDLRKLLV